VRISLARVLVWFVCGCACGQQLLQVENAASLRTGDIAAGSLVQLDLFPQGGGPVAPLDPATVSAKLLPMGFHDPLPLPIREILDPLSVLVLIPRDTPVGNAGVTLNYNGQTASQNVNIVATSFGLYSAGFGGAAVAQNVTAHGLQPNNLTHPAHPQDFVTLWGTGLGAASADQVIVLLGGHPFPVAYAGPSAEFAGLDQINFQMPDDPTIPQGCYVAVNIGVANSISNLATLSLSRDEWPCRHPFGLTTDQLAQLDAGGRAYLGRINLYSTIGPVPGQSLSPQNGYVRMDFGDAEFLNYDASGLSAISSPLFADDYLSGCKLSGGASASFIAVTGILNVGDQVNVLGPDRKELDLLPQGLDLPSLYSGSEPTSPVVDSPNQLPAAFFSAGEWQAIAPGSSTVQPFSFMVAVPNPIQITNYDQTKAVDHTKDLTVTWDPTTYSDADFVNVQLYGQLPTKYFGPSQSVFCRIPALAGQATIPAAMLATFPPATGSLSLSIERKSGTVELSKIELNDGTSIPAAFQYHSAEWIFVQFQ